MTSSEQLNADQVADIVGWQVNSVYRNRSRSLARVAARLELRAHDFPPGRFLDQGLRWTREEIEDYETARAKYRVRGGRPRTRDDTAAPATGAAEESDA